MLISHNKHWYKIVLGNPIQIMNKIRQEKIQKFCHEKLETQKI